LLFAFVPAKGKFEEVLQIVGKGRTPFFRNPGTIEEQAGHAVQLLSATINFGEITSMKTNQHQEINYWSTRFVSRIVLIYFLHQSFVQNDGTLISGQEVWNKSTNIVNVEKNTLVS